jgi:tRNA (adenine57-N1/adenine58-N1)-methyltransferase
MFIMPGIYKGMKRGPQVIQPKDIGIIISFTGIGKESVCVDAGTGSGWLAVSLARICKEVYSYDVREDFIKIAEKNRNMFGLSNLFLKKGDVTKSIKERNVDLVTLDMPSAEKALSSAKRALKVGGIVVGYTPHMEQAKAFVMKLNSLKFRDIMTVEVIVRDIMIRKEGVRPSNTGLWHTAYITFGTKT